MQMSMLAYATLDIFAEKAQTTPDYEVYMKKKKEKGGAPVEPEAEEQTYLGLLMQTFVDRYEIDIYGYISITNMKYLVFKIEGKLNPVSVNPTDRHMRKIFEKLLNYHTEMLLNPFFDFDQMSQSKCYQAKRGNQLGSASHLEEEEKSDYSSSSDRSSNSEKEI